MPSADTGYANGPSSTHDGGPISPPRFLPIALAVVLLLFAGCSPTRSIEAARLLFDVARIDPAEAAESVPRSSIAYPRRAAGSREGFMSAVTADRAPDRPVPEGVAKSGDPAAALASHHDQISRPFPLASLSPGFTPACGPRPLHGAGHLPARLGCRTILMMTATCTEPHATPASSCRRQAAKRVMVVSTASSIWEAVPEVLCREGSRGRGPCVGHAAAGAAPAQLRRIGRPGGMPVSLRTHPLKGLFAPAVTNLPQHEPREIDAEAL